MIVVLFYFGNRRCSCLSELIAQLLVVYTNMRAIFTGFGVDWMEKYEGEQNLDKYYGQNISLTT